LLDRSATGPDLNATSRYAAARSCAVKSFPFRQGAPARISWARLLKRVFDVDVEHCPNCGGALKIIAAIDDPPVIVKILSHLGLPTRGPPRAPARRVDLFQTI
jgi:hypothetical protein